MKTINIEYKISDDGEVKSSISCTETVSLMDIIICLGCDQKFFHEISPWLLREYNVKTADEIKEAMNLIRLREVLERPVSDFPNIKKLLTDE